MKREFPNLINDAEGAKIHVSARSWYGRIKNNVRTFMERKKYSCQQKFAGGHGQRNLYADQFS